MNPLLFEDLYYKVRHSLCNLSCARIFPQLVCLPFLQAAIVIANTILAIPILICTQIRLPSGALAVDLGSWQQCVDGHSKPSIIVIKHILTKMIIWFWNSSLGSKEGMSTFPRKSTIQGMQLSWVVNFPGQSTSPGSQLSLKSNFPRKWAFPGSQLSRDFNFPGKSTFPGSQLSRNCWIQWQKSAVVTVVCLEF